MQHEEGSSFCLKPAFQLHSLAYLKNLAGHQYVITFTLGKEKLMDDKRCKTSQPVNCDAGRKQLNKKMCITIASPTQVSAARWHSTRNNYYLSSIGLRQKNLHRYWQENSVGRNATLDLIVAYEKSQTSDRCLWEMPASEGPSNCPAIGGAFWKLCIARIVPRHIKFRKTGSDITGSIRITDQIASAFLFY
ncbi:hypothetical protein CEXT_227781 [Caerostris extrusa]|uniref:Uncharacterized protein n=1 Tax=Caerostris extrusa TaxID=172846 RepID=A0AAV4NLL8_CAEEX|nr:hypothetical protein CEXT_227781 [Caerostris extrusa]